MKDQATAITSEKPCRGQADPRRRTRQDNCGRAFGNLLQEKSTVREIACKARRQDNFQ